MSEPKQASPDDEGAGAGQTASQPQEQQPAPRRGLTRTVARGLFYPMARVGEQLRDSGSNIREMRRQMRERQAQREQEDRERLEQLRAQGHDVLDDHGRFEALYEANGWTPQRLEQQLRTVILTRRLSLAGAGLGLLMALSAIIFQSNRWLAFLMCLVAAAICALGLARAMKFGLQQAQIEERCLMRWSKYFSREDFFRHVFF